MDLLYVLKSAKPLNPPFSFDDNARGFDKGVWTTEKKVETNKVNAQAKK